MHKCKVILSQIKWIASVFLLATGSAGAVVIDFGFTGAGQAFVVPIQVNSIFAETWGAQGWSGRNQGGLGGYSSGDIGVTPGETIWLYVGGQGTQANGNRVPMGGGFNGGGDGQSNSSSSGNVGGGGGASDLRLIFGDLTSRILVAGGGGGSTNNLGSFGGAGGGLVGGTGGSAGRGRYPGGAGGTQIAGGVLGGAFGLGGDATTNLTPWNGGGGAGWYGGGVSAAHAGGGGGSSYVGSLANTTMFQGIQPGNGHIRLTFEPSLNSVPEPSTLALLGFGLAAFGFSRKNKA